MDNKISAILIDPCKRIVQGLRICPFIAFDLYCDLERLIEGRSEADCGDIIPLIKTDKLDYGCDIEYVDLKINNENMELISVYNPKGYGSASTPVFEMSAHKGYGIFFKPAIIVGQGVNHLEFDRLFGSDCPLTVENVIQNLQWGEWIDQDMSVSGRTPASMEDVR